MDSAILCGGDNLSIIKPIAQLLGYILDILFKGLNAIGIGNIAIAIIIFTLLVKMLMLPLQIKQQKMTKLQSVMNPEIKAIQEKYKGKNISDILNMTVEEASRFFENLPRIHRKIKTLMDVGMGYVKMGQPSTQLSGGEAQRIKLAFELSKVSTGQTLYILDEPTTGLHTDDVKRLNEILQRLVSAGNSVIVIEHNLDIIKCADYIIDLGPEGGDKGGTILITGTPEEVAKHEASYTGQYLRKML